MILQVIYAHVLDNKRISAVAHQIVLVSKSPNHHPNHQTHDKNSSMIAFLLVHEPPNSFQYSRCGAEVVYKLCGFGEPSCSVVDASNVIVEVDNVHKEPLVISNISLRDT